MEAFLGNLTSQAMNYAIRSGITITTTYALNQCSRLVKETTQDSGYRNELLQLQRRLESKISIMSPSIDMIELISARGNTTLESAVNLTKAIRIELQKLGAKVENAVEAEGHLCKVRKAGCNMTSEKDLIEIIRSIKNLLTKIEDAIPLINLAITTSGVNLSTKLSGTISPSRLLQASTFLTAADTKYVLHHGSRQQVGPTWTLSLYMLFAGHANRAVEDGAMEATWKEVIHKARVALIRVSLEALYEVSGTHKAEIGQQNSYRIPGEGEATEFAYHLVLAEDFDDDRVHTFDENESIGSFLDVAHTGIRDVVPIHEVSKIFYADTGKILNIGSDDETNNPVLLIKRDVHAEPPRRMLQRSTSQMSSYGHDSAHPWYEPLYYYSAQGTDDQSEIDDQIHRESTPVVSPRARDSSHEPNLRWRLPVDLDPEWMAFEVYSEEPDSASDIEEDDANSRPISNGSEDSLSREMSKTLKELRLNNPCLQSDQLESVSARGLPAARIKTSLSLLEMLIKLTALQQFRQDSHLAIEDELLNFFLEDSATAGAGSDKEFRQRLRHDAVRRVGFDPYDESPVKRRGEEYIANKRGKASPRPQFDADAFKGRLSNGFANGYQQAIGQPDFVRRSLERSSPSPRESPSPSRPEGSEKKKTGTPLSVASLRGSPQTANKIGPQLLKASSHDSLLLIPHGAVNRGRATIRARSEPKRSNPLATEYANEEISEADLEDYAAMLEGGI